MAIIKKDGQTFASVPAGNLDAWLETNKLNRADVEIERTAKEVKQGIRADIHTTAGDTGSLLGTTADGVQMTLYGLATISAGLAAAKTIADVNAAAAPFAELSASFLGKVQSGTVVLPFLVKGEASVVADIETRATAVSAALTAAQGEAQADGS